MSIKIHIFLFYDSLNFIYFSLHVEEFLALEFLGEISL